MDDVLADIELPRRRRFTVEEYYRMAEAGILTAEDRVELIEGEIIQMAAIGQRHAVCVAELTRRLVLAVGDRALLWPQNPVRLFRDTEPQPDVALLRPPFNQYWEHPARPEDVLLVIEVSDTTYRYDRFVKLPLYARAAVPEVWIVNLPEDVVETFRGPGPDGYGFVNRFTRGTTVSPAAFPDVALAVDDVVPPR